MKKDNYYSVFVVDDDKKLLTMLKHVIERNTSYNAEVMVFDTVEEFLRHLNEKPDIVVLDYYFESEEEQAPTGLEVMQKIKEVSPHTEVVIISGQDDIDTALETIREGAYDYVVKDDRAIPRTQLIVDNIMKARSREYTLKQNNKNLRLVIGIMVVFILALIAFLAYALYLQEHHI
jgi:DNA-binding NtrC family response regulator